MLHIQEHRARTLRLAQALVDVTQLHGECVGITLSGLLSAYATLAHLNPQSAGDCAEALERLSKDLRQIAEKTAETRVH